MPNTRDLRRRVRSIRNTEQLTRAMKMVAAARLRRSQEQILAARPYAHAMRNVLARLAARTDASRHPLLAERGDQKIEVIMTTGIVRKELRRRLRIRTPRRRSFSPNMTSSNTRS